ncbi:hypothetical protein BD770DRAFT_458382 [Pilaira anomala]|nr:hypothetical protein BD770DRAFT_458382 [Pilaira anomala]
MYLKTNANMIGFDQVQNNYSSRILGLLYLKWREFNADNVSVPASFVPKAKNKGAKTHTLFDPTFNNQLKNFLKSHDVFSVDIKSLQSNVILMITEYIYSSIRSRMNIFYYPNTVVDNLKMPWITIDAKWKLNKSQTDYLKTLIGLIFVL